MTISLLPFQQELKETQLQILSKFGAVLNACEMGLGKTAMTIATLIEMKPARVLVVAPSSLRFNWLQEFLKWSDKAEEYTQVITSLKDTLQNKKITIISYNMLSHPRMLAMLKKYQPSVIVIDEAHYIKSASSKRTKACLGLVQYCKAKAFFLTGTPITNKPLDLFPLLQFFNSRGLNSYDLSSYWPFVRKYCDAKQGRFGWIVDGASNIPELKGILSNIMVRKEKAEVLKELPDKIIRVIPIVFDEARARKYALETEQLVKEPFDITKIKFDEHIASARAKLGELKIEPAIEHIKSVVEQKGKVVVFAWHKKVIDGLTEGLKDYVCITGASSAKDREDAVSKFQRGERSIFIGNIMAAGVGLTLTAADHVVMVEHDWTPSNNEQAEDRIHRIGQRSVCVIDYLVAKNSLEHKVFNHIGRKDSIIKTIMAA
jgi:SWI/SNF-related matrix-associated actin-dependent regulator 1 of chromatin subfamily A